MELGRARNAVSQLRRGTLEYCVLALLRDGQRYGFELVRTLSEADGLLVSEGTIYPLLSRLRRDRLVSTSWQESETGPPRRYYQLTGAGQRALADFSDEWARFRDSVDAVLTTQGDGQ
jgi:PadR family transcriptional regulator PadR